VPGHDPAAIFPQTPPLKWPSPQVCVHAWNRWRPLHALVAFSLLTMFLEPIPSTLGILPPPSLGCQHQGKIMMVPESSLPVLCGSERLLESVHPMEAPAIHLAWIKAYGLGISLVDCC